MAIKTSKEIAEWYGKSERTIQYWVSDGVPIHRKGGAGSSSLFDTIQVHNWLQEREIAKRVVASNGEHYDRQEEEARLKHHQANMEELKEQEKRGELIPVDVAIEEFGEKVSNARAKMLILDQSVPKKHREGLNAAIRQVLDELSQAEIEAA